MAERPGAVPGATCGEEMRLLVQADADGELDAAQAAQVAAHVMACPGCAALQDRLGRLRGVLRAGMEYNAPTAEARQRWAALLPAAPPRSSAGAEQPSPAPLRRRWRWPGWTWPTSSFAAGAAMAVGIGFAVLDAAPPSGADVTASVLGSHVRALQPGHLSDVVSTDQHTVKPWFDGRLPFSPPVKDLAAAGFPLEGGRLDYAAGREVAAMVYRHAKHPIDLFAWPAAGRGDAAPRLEARDGFNLVHWTAGGMQLWAVSELNAAELMQFVRLWQSGP